MSATATTDYSQLSQTANSRLSSSADHDKPTDFISVIVGWLYYYFRPIIKGFLRLTTRLCELQRICYGESKGGPRTLGVESSLRQSRSQAIKEALTELDAKLLRSHRGEVDVVDPAAAERAAIDAAVAVILAAKKIKKNLHQQFVVSLRYCLRQIWGYQRLIREVEALKSQGFDSDNIEHERSLLKLWELLQPGVPLLSRKTKEWQNLGFQGDDPKTDFRGMGILGLQNLLYFASEYNTAAKYVLSHSHHPNHGYSFAIVGINLTHMAYRFLSEGAAKSHFYNAAARAIRAAEDADGNASAAVAAPTIENFHHFYCYLFVEFDKFWLEMKPSSMMSFSYVRDLFETRVRNALSDPNTCFKINIGVDTV